MYRTYKKDVTALCEARRRTGGFTLLEFIMVVAVAGIILGIGALNLRPLGGELKNATEELTGFMRQTRARAMATTSAYRIVYTSPTKLAVQQGRTCKATGAGAWTPDATLKLELRDGVTVTNGWDSQKRIVCFSSRGIADANETVKLKDKNGKQAEIEVFIGGALEIR